MAVTTAGGRAGGLRPCLGRTGVVRKTRAPLCGSTQGPSHLADVQHSAPRPQPREGLGGRLLKVQFLLPGEAAVLPGGLQGHWDKAEGPIWAQKWP